MTTPELVPMIIPTVMIPLTLISVGVSVVASFIAALFGIDLKMEGPKKLLEVLLKPRVLATAFLLNAIIMGGIYGWKWWMNYPRLISTIEKESAKRAVPSDLLYEDRATVRTQFSSQKELLPPQGVKELWKIETGAGSFRGAVISNGRIFTGNDNGIISEVDPASGKVIRTFYIGTAASTEITIWKNFMFVGEGLHDTHHARIYKFDLTTGKFAGSYQTLGHTEAQAVVATHVNVPLLLVVGGADGLHAVDPISMEKKWQLNIGHMDAGVLSDEKGTIFFGTGREKHDDKKYKSYAAAVNFKTGAILWQRELPASSWMRPVFVDQNVCYITGEIYFPSERGHIACFDKTSGEHTAAMNTPEPIASTPRVLDQSILYATIHGRVCRFDLVTHKNTWCHVAGKSEKASFAGPSYDEERHLVLYPSLMNGLFVLNPDNGELVMNWKPENWQKTYADAAVGKNIWVLSDNEGSVRGLEPQLVPEMVKAK